MGDVNLHCVSPDSVPLSPDLRVNYEFGLVLGVDEFRQEQRYFLEKDWLHDRALHGYGTVYGLDVTVDRPPDNANEVMVTVHAGMGVDQWGRPVVIRNDQCARLGAWLAAKEAAEPGATASHRDENGNVVVHVVASYDQCLEALVPIPGQPCSSSEETRAASRIRDSAKIDLVWDPPVMPAWGAVRVVADLLARIEADPDAAVGDGDEAAVIEAIRAMDPSGAGPLMPGESPRLPAVDLREALDRIFTVWVTEVRPRFAPPLTEPDGGDPPAEAAVLLATLRFVPADPFDNAAPAITEFQPADDTGRPYLLHTQLLQELIALGWRGGGAAVVPGPVANARELVTFDTVGGGEEQRSRVLAWFHLPKPVRLPEQIECARGQDEVVVPFAAKPVNDVNGFSTVWQLIPEDEKLRDGDLLAFRFPTEAVMVADDGITLASVIDAEGLELVGHDVPETVFAYHIVELAEPGETEPHEHPHEHDHDPIPAVLAMATQPLATVTVTASDNLLFVEMWFHVDIRTRADEARVVRPHVRVFAETLENSPRELRLTEMNEVKPNVFQARVTAAAWKRVDNSPWLRFLFFTDSVVVAEGADMSLEEFIQTRRVKFEGHDGADVITEYVRIGEVGR